MSVRRKDKPTSANQPTTEDLIGEAKAKADADEEEQVTLPPMPEYPVDALVGPLKDLVGSTKLPPALIAGPGLACLAAVCGAAKVELDGTEDWPILWIPNIGPRSSGKTPSLNYAMRRFRELEKGERSRRDAAIKEWSDSSEDNKGEKPPDMTITVDDITIEKLAPDAGCQPAQDRG